MKPSKAPASASLLWLKTVGEGLASVVLPFLFIYVAIYMSGKMPGKVGSDSRLHPMAN